MLELAGAERQRRARRVSTIAQQATPTMDRARFNGPAERYAKSSLRHSPGPKAMSAPSVEG
jgi:hypothetical protein